jgi:hypothetical protein
MGEIKLNKFIFIELSLYCLDKHYKYQIRLNFFDIDIENEIDQINHILCFNLE